MASGLAVPWSGSGVATGIAEMATGSWQEWPLASQGWPLAHTGQDFGTIGSGQQPHRGGHQPLLVLCWDFVSSEALERETGNSERFSTAFSIYSLSILKRLCPEIIPVLVQELRQSQK